MCDDSRTLYCGNLSSRCNEDILYELFLQGGPLERVHIPRDRDGSLKNFGFITYKHAMSVMYAISLFEGTTLFNRQLTLKTRQAPELPPPLPQQQMPMQTNPVNINQMIMGHQMPQHFGMNMIPMFLPPGVPLYPSQIMSSSSGKEPRYQSRNHPYSREREWDRGRDYDRDRDRHQDYGHRSQNHRREHKSHHRGANDYSRNNRHYR
ncbi:hypothetical protein PV326_006372 [Microctonus aethiopoides]|nr:hypothetical protein PV326_006372 [Microctonus aethiopoides]